MSAFEGNTPNLNINFYCPITQELMDDPVMDSEGNSYERSAIEHWISIRGTSPITRAPLLGSSLVPNRALKAAIEAARAGLPNRFPGNAPVLDPLVVPSLPPAAELQLEVMAVPSAYLLPNHTPGHSFVMAQVIAPADLERVPVDAVVVIDTSGSMQTEANCAGVESSGLSMLDIVKHAVKTIIKTLQKEDRLAIVSYSNAAVKVCELTLMNESGQKLAIEKLESLVEEGMTNLWDGLKTALDMLYERDQTIIIDLPSASRQGVIYLLTDGVPNVDPPRGYVPSMQRIRDQKTGKYPGPINTFGFGYNLQSDLLLQIAEEGQGVYAFIPDSGFVGTVFVNALANSLTTIANQCNVSISTERSDKKIEAVDAGAVQAQQRDSVNFKGKGMQVGVPLGNVCLVDDADLPLVLSKLQYVPTGRAEPVTLTLVGPSAMSAEQDAQELAAEYFRSAAVIAMKKCLQLAESKDYAGAGSEINALLVSIDRWLGNTTACDPKAIPRETKPQPRARDRVSALREDLNGQVREATSKDEYFNKWGKHFLRSIMRAHQVKQCNNFKDPGVQMYGNTLFTTIRDAADDIFSTLPPPVPKAKRAPQPRSMGFGGVTRAAAPTPVASMSYYNDRDRGCFHGNSLVTLISGQRVPAKAVRAGDILYDGGRVKCVVKSAYLEGRAQLIRLPSTTECEQGLLISPYHPVLWQGRWQFPVHIGEWVECACDAVYSFLVESASAAGTYTPFALVDGVPTATLAHGVQGIPCLSHAFFGTTAVVEALQQCPGFQTGLVVFTQPGYFVRNRVTNDVCGLHVSMAAQC